MWAFPKQGSYKMGLRKLVKSFSVYEILAKKLQKHILEEFTEDKKYEAFVNSIFPVNDTPEVFWLKESISEMEEL